MTKHKYYYITDEEGKKLIMSSENDIATYVESELEMMNVGETKSIEVGVVEFTDKEAEALPEYDG